MRDPAGADRTIVVAHGAGAGMDHPFMVGFSRAMNDLGVATLRFNFPYMDAGRRSPDRQPVAVATWRAAFDAAVARAPVGEPVWASGKSFGGRMASVAVAEGMPAAGLVFLGYPLHPPGKPERVRDEHLYAIDGPDAVPPGHEGSVRDAGGARPSGRKAGRPGHATFDRGRRALARAIP